MEQRQPRTWTTWLGAAAGAVLLLVVADKAFHSGSRVFLRQHFTLRYTVTDEGGGHPQEIIHQFSGARARQVGAGLFAVSLLATLWILPTLWPGWWTRPLRKQRFLRLTLGTAAAALLLIWPPWQIASSGIAAVTYLLLSEFAAWRGFTRKIGGKRRAELRGLVLLASFMSINVVGLLLFGTDALSAAWIGAALAGVVILHLSLLRWNPRRLPESGQAG